MQHRATLSGMETTRVSVTLPLDKGEQLERLAVENGRSGSGEARVAILAHLAAAEKKAGEA